MINEIKHLFPNADPLVDFELRDNSDGKGPFIARWDAVKLGAQPTAAQLSAVTVVADIAAFKTPALNAFRATREQMFSRIAGMGFAALQKGDTVTAAALAVFRDGIRDLPQHPSTVAATTPVELKTAMTLRYKELTDALPLSVKAAFQALDK